MDVSEIQPLLEGIELTRVVLCPYRWKNVVFIPCEFIPTKATPYLNYTLTSQRELTWLLARLRFLFPCELSTRASKLIYQQFIAAVFQDSEVSAIIPFRLSSYNDGPFFQGLRLSVPLDKAKPTVPRDFIDLILSEASNVADFFLYQYECIDDYCDGVNILECNNGKFTREGLPNLYDDSDDEPERIDILNTFLEEYFILDDSLDIDNIVGKMAGHWV